MEMKTNSKVLFITVNPKGHGKTWAEAALKRGHQVIATTGNTDLLDDLVKDYQEAILPIQFDIKDKHAGFKAVESGLNRFGRIDAAIDAGFNLYGDLQTPVSELKALLENELFGLSWLMQAVLPVMKTQGYGDIVQVSGLSNVKILPTLGHYPPTKWGMEAFSKALTKYIRGFGIELTLIKFGASPSDTDKIRSTNEVVDFISNDLYACYQASNNDPAAAADIVLAIIEKKKIQIASELAGS